MTITSGFVEGSWASAGHKTFLFTGSSTQTYDLIDAKHNPGLAQTFKLEGTGAVTLTPVAGQTIDGQSSFVLATQYSQITVMSDGSNWLVTSVQNGNAINQAALSQVNLTGQTAAITATNLVASALAGMYRVTVDLIVTTVGTAGTLGATIASNNGVAAFSQASSTASLTALGAEVSQTFTLYSAAGQAITYATALAGATGTPAYAARFHVEYLG